MADYLDAVSEDVTQLQARYDQAVDDLGVTWRELAMESNPRRRVKLEKRASTLTRAARELAGRVALASKALETLRCRN